MFSVLRRKITNTFPLQPVPKYRLSDAIADDDYGDRHFTFEETWKSWDEIENWQIVKCDIFFCFAPPEAAAYMIPRYMVFVLDEIEEKLPSESRGYSSRDTAVWHLQRLQKKKYKNSSLTLHQINVIEGFLVEIRSDPDYSATLDLG